jgi:plasmid stability protein
MPARLVRMPLGLPPELHRWLRLAAAREGRPMAAIARDAIEQYRERTDPQLELPMGGDVVVMHIREPTGP